MKKIYKFAKKKTFLLYKMSQQKIRKINTNKITK